MINRPSIQELDNVNCILHCKCGASEPPHPYSYPGSDCGLQWICGYEAPSGTLYQCGYVYKDESLSRNWYEPDFSDEDHWSKKKLRRIKNDKIKQ